jgi:hypothetical protein
MALGMGRFGKGMSPGLALGMARFGKRMALGLAKFGRGMALGMARVEKECLSVWLGLAREWF